MVAKVTQSAASGRGVADVVRESVEAVVGGVVGWGGWFVGVGVVLGVGLWVVVLVVLILHVLADGSRRDAVRGEEPVQVPGARAVEAEPDRGTREHRDDARLEIDLQVDDQVERLLRERATNVNERRHALRAVEDDDFIDRSMAANQRRWPRL